ncbi:MAG: Ig-like domain-containing protein [Chloroflexota bacterium]|nr:Ig-like domain-containing protein [Chloroflexota bacterium]
MILRSLLVIGVGGVLLAGVLYVASTIDARAPEVLSISVTQPVGGDASLALITTSIEVEFNEEVDTDAAEAALRIDPEVDGAASWSGSTMIFTPDEALGLETAYTVSLAPGVRDLAGNDMAELPPEFSFMTAGRPTVLETNPADGAVDVSLEEPIQLRFSSLMDTPSVEAGLRLVPRFPHDLRWSEELLEIVPSQPLAPDQEYRVEIDASAADAAGVQLGEEVSLEFRTVAPGLAIETLLPADGVDGIAQVTTIGIVFDRAIDPASVTEDLVVITPEVAGSLTVVPVPGEPAGDDGSGRVLLFTPSGPLPPTTTFTVEIAPGVTGAAEGRGLAEPVTWTFTTGPPPSDISNQITFLSDRSGITNLWAMNPDGTGQRQVSVELAPILDYAVAPDGSSVVVGDGRRLVYLRADGTDRRVLTGEDAWDLDATYAPSGNRIAFVRFESATGIGLGLWEWQVGGGDPQPMELPDDLRASPEPSPSGEDDRRYRAPRYAPDGSALAFVDLDGSVGILELPAERLTLVPFAAAAAPTWLADSSGVLLSGRDEGEPALPIEPPAGPLEPASSDSIYRVARSGVDASETPLGRGWRVIAVAPDGRLAYTDALGRLGVAPTLGSAGIPSHVEDERVVAAAFAPGDAFMALVLSEEGSVGSLELLDLESGERTHLAPDAALPRWLP